MSFIFVCDRQIFLYSFVSKRQITAVCTIISSSDSRSSLFNIIIDHQRIIKLLAFKPVIKISSGDLLDPLKSVFYRILCEKSLSAVLCRLQSLPKYAHIVPMSCVWFFLSYAKISPKTSSTNRLIGSVFS